MGVATMLDTSEIKRLVPIETVVAHYGGTLTAKGEGRCLLPQRHTNGDATPSMTVKDARVMCWSQQCFGEKGADVFELVGIMEGLSYFSDQKRRVYEIGGISECRIRRSQRPIPTWGKINLVAVAFRFELAALDRRLRAERIIAAGKALDVSRLNDADLDDALSCVAQAHADMERAELFEHVADILRMKDYAERVYGQPRRVA